MALQSEELILGLQGGTTIRGHHKPKNSADNEMFFLLLRIVSALLQSLFLQSTGER